MRRTALAVGIIVSAASIRIAPARSRLSHRPTPRTSSPVSAMNSSPGTPGFPGIATGVEESFVDSGGTAAAAWSATTLFGGPLDVC